MHIWKHIKKLILTIALGVFVIAGNVSAETGSGSTTVSVGQIPPPGWTGGSCPMPGTSATMSWGAVSGASYYSYRVDDTRDGWGTGNDYAGDTSGTSFSFTGTPGVYYSVWVHARGPDGSWSDAVGGGFSCIPTPPPPAPSIYLVSTWGVGDGATSGTTYYGAAFYIRWNAVANADSCSINGSGVSTGGGTWSGTATSSHGYTITCSGAGGSGSAYAVISVPPPPTSVSLSCDSAGTTGYLSWGAPSGWNTFYSRVYSNSAGAYQYVNDGQTGTSTSFGTTPAHQYYGWVHTRAGNGAWSQEVYSSAVNCPAPLPNPSLTIYNTPYISNGAQSGTTYYGASYTLSWGPVTYASSCSLSGYGGVSTSGGTVSFTATATSTGHTLTCSGPAGSASSSVTVSVPPPPTSISSSCSANGQTGYLSWGAPSGWNTFYSRSYNTNTGSYGHYSDSMTGTSTSFSTTPGHNYSSWVHTRAANGAWSQEIYSYMGCPNPNPTALIEMLDSYSYSSYVHFSFPTYAWNDTGVYIRWSSTDATSCTVYDNGSPRWSGTASSGVAVGALGGIAHTYSIQCFNPYSGTAGTDALTLSIPASPTNVTFGACSGNTTTLSWNQNASYGRGAPYIYENGALIYNGDAIAVGGSGSVSVNTVPGRTYTAIVYARDARYPAWPYSHGVNPSGVLCPATSGSLSVTPSCTIPVGGNSCSVGVSWSVTNPASGGATAVTRNGASGAGTVPGTSATSGSTSSSISYGTTNFFLYHNGAQLDTTRSATASCASGSGWDGSSCVPPSTVAVNANPLVLNDPGTSYISWTSTNATSCVASGYGAGGGTGTSGGFTTPTLTGTTDYGVTCGGAGGIGNNSVTVRMDRCPNMADYQETIPYGYEKVGGNCTRIDLCSDVPDYQFPSPPTGTTQNPDGTCGPKCVNYPAVTVVPPGWTRDSNSICQPPTPICPNLGSQVTVMPPLYTLTDAGACIPGSGACQGADYCPNINGMQGSVPTGFQVTNSGTCVPTSGDYCQNISGTQNEVPGTLTLDGASNCVEWDRTTCPAGAIPGATPRPIFIEPGTSSR